jgi:hypothetical protein
LAWQCWLGVDGTGYSRIGMVAVVVSPMVAR